MNYEVTNNIATLTMDDGKANAFGPALIAAFNEALDRAEREKVGAVIVRGRDGMFSAGFDLGEFKKGAEAGTAMANAGFELLLRLYSFPLPLVAACTGHGIALGAFVIMTCDMRIGCQGKFKLSLPETAIGMELPPLLMGLAESRIPPNFLTRVALNSENFDPDQAVSAGLLDETVSADELTARSTDAAEKLAQLPQAQFAKNKLAIRAVALQCMRDGLK
ncbi:crotonase/enoyl-CoA hydratase family protein [Halieaceae bacterium IMCC14734]|uniref:Crotonase/enoyl-CoA hydratase family protein n=1 Tax=Candidatus Litorirhabdus singularis TaxID=2518993 RepID=A0ABT3TGH4_9GAMM|nr:crotonase/enoyl-CoA hydratase family protein [Candidatus Litorirhabdus singularis]MCX2980915.1 crotonase/enoyl-CoA hydratase family protein [Candidatus Litorirhabdus singularis]